MAAAHPLEVIVIGAGSTGLLIAQGCREAGIKVTVYEREDATRYITRPREWGMSLHWGSEYLMSLLPEHRREQMREAVTCDPYFTGSAPGVPIYNAQTGEKFFSIPHAAPMRVSRRKLRDFLAHDIDLHYGKELTKLEREENTGRIKATFKDGTSATGTFVIGSDGGNSLTRQQLVGKEAAKSTLMDHYIFNVSCTLPRDTALYIRKCDPILRIAYHPANFMWMWSIQDVQDPDKPESWKFQHMLSWQGSPRPEDLPNSAARVKYWKEQGMKSAEPWKRIAEGLPDDLEFPQDQVTYWKPIDWSNSEFYGHVTLAGDAAHPIPPFRGQGLNLGLQDASDLVKGLKEVQAGTKSLAEMVTAYETEMRERSTFELGLSINQTETHHDFEKVTNSPIFKVGIAKSQEVRAAQEKEAQENAAKEQAAQSATSGS